MHRPALALAALILAAPPAAALVGGATVVRDAGAGKHIVMIVGTRGNLCTGTALARDLVLTAAHCVAPAAIYLVLLPDAPSGMAIRQIAVHPRYDAKHYAGGRVTADVALLKLATSLPDSVTPATLASGANVAAGDRFVIAGYGSTTPGTNNGTGTARAATLVATGKPGSLQIRLVDPATNDKSPGLGACIGDSGGPAFRQSGGTFAAVGVISWSSGAANTGGCGGLSGITPLQLYRGWIFETAKTMGSAL